NINNNINDFNLKRKISPTPFIPSSKYNKDERLSEIFNIQALSLSRRIKHTKSSKLIIGVSGGLDSTLALLVAVKACDILGLKSDSVMGVTMPGFGTTNRTLNNAKKLMASLKITTKEIDITLACKQHFKDIGHDENEHDITYENAQARIRTQILLDLANKHRGIVIGTGDLSELALGFATFAGDHISMYGVNSGVPKTLIRHLVNWHAKQLDSNSREVLLDILDTPISPELIPPDNDGNIVQQTEKVLGDYMLHDFFLYYFVRFGFSIDKIKFLALYAFKNKYKEDYISNTLNVFIKRCFSQQFKRSCLPDGPKIGSVSLSPRTDWKMPSDCSSAIWQNEI
ncbi:MAG: NAD(+) synthase, partial [Oscillospiraceae bacterium]|nr:NAD(+) synthase [Oscillospiraceae bacterium]